MNNFPDGMTDGRNKEMLAQLLFANIKNGNYEGDDPIIKEHPEWQLSFVAKKTLFLMGYNRGWKWIHTQEDKFYKKIDLVDEIINEAKRTMPKEKNAQGTWQIGFCAGAISYLNGYIQQKERIQQLINNKN